MKANLIAKLHRCLSIDKENLKAKCMIITKQNDNLVKPEEYAYPSYAYHIFLVVYVIET